MFLEQDVFSIHFKLIPLRAEIYQGSLLFSRRKRKIPLLLTANKGVGIFFFFNLV